MLVPPLGPHPTLDQALAQVAALEAERNVLYQLLDAVPAMVLYKGPQSRIRYANAAFREFYGMSAAELQNMIDAPFNDPDNTLQYIKDDLQVFASGERLNIPNEPVTRSDGVVEQFHTVKTPVRDPEGAIIGTVGISENISRLQAIQDSMAEQAARFARLIANIPGMVYQFVLDTDGGMSFPYVSEGSRGVYGLEPEAIERDSAALLSKIHPDDQASLQSTILTSAETLEPWVWEGRTLTEHKGEIWIQGTSRPLRRPDGSTIWDGVVIDVSARKNAELMQMRFASILDAAPDFVGIATPEGQGIYMNPAGRKMIGVPLDEDATTLQISAAHPQWALNVMLEESIPAAIRTGSWLGESAVQHRDGHEIPVSQAIICQRDASGKPLFLATIIRDLTGQKEAEAERERLQRQIIQAQALALAELSTPLIALHDRMVLMPLIGTIDSQRAQQVIETLLNGAAAYQASAAIIDVSGVPVVDTQVASALIHAAQALRLLGTAVIITGIRPEIAQTMVSLGVNMRDIATFSRLNQGLDHAMRTIGGR